VDTPRPSPRTKWTRRVPHLVLIGRAAAGADRLRLDAIAHFRAEKLPPPKALGAPPALRNAQAELRGLVRRHSRTARGSLAAHSAAADRTR